MNWSSLSEFLDMGGYALYVWGSFGMCAAVIAIELFSVAQRRRTLRQQPLDDLDERNDMNERPLHEA